MIDIKALIDAPINTWKTDKPYCLVGAGLIIVVFTLRWWFS